MRTLKIHLIRHGLTDGNLEGLYIGHTDVSLCEQGRMQLLQMKEDYDYPEPSVVFSSPLKRCIETAAILFPEKNPVLEPRLCEYNFGSFEGRSADDLHEKEPLFDRWLAGEKDVNPPFGESNEEFAGRICESFISIIDGALKTESDDIVIITHGGVLTALMSFFALPEASMHDWLTPSGCGYTLRITPEIWMAGRKVEAIEEIPYEKNRESSYYDGWDYYPEDDGSFEDEEE